MRLGIRKISLLVLAAIVLLVPTTRGVSSVTQVLPNPVLNFLGQEPYTIGNKNFIRYNYEVTNRDAFPNTMFAAAPTLPPCGSNTKSARTWVDIYDQRGKRIYGYCAFGNHNDLNGFSFSMETDVIPPSYVYIELNDRQTNTKYKSNLADTTL